MSLSKFRIAVLISGNGTNLQAIIDACESGDVAATIACVISSKAGAFGLERAGRAGISAHTLPRREYGSGSEYDAALAQLVDRYDVDLIVLAGFMHILGSEFVNRYPNRIINLHPSLLPRHKGLNTHARALAANDKLHGASVHFVTPDLDGGPVIIQASIPIESEDTADTLQQKVHQLEYQILPRAIDWLAHQRVKLINGRVELDEDVVVNSDL